MYVEVAKVWRNDHRNIYTGAFRADERKKEGKREAIGGIRRSEADEDD